MTGLLIAIIAVSLGMAGLAADRRPMPVPVRIKPENSRT